ncbi:response regulator [Luteococcus sp. Sow4_B9]|uniref:response regulator n=1 Tax=Luteococcus sp. Sow4_B9 TaxID=3438792 RepID=UPI003F995BA4
MTSAAIRVVICDDDPLARQTLATYLNHAPGISVVSVHADATSALDAVMRDSPDVLLSDINMPALSGIEAARWVAEQHLPTKVLLITALSDLSTTAALQAGAAGYVLKSVSPGALVDAVRAVHRGLAVVSEAPFRSLFPQVPDGVRPDLTAEERRTLNLLCRGLSNAQIAETMYVSLSTAKRHLTSAMRKLGTTSRLSTVLEAQRLGLDDMSPE